MRLLRAGAPGAESPGVELPDGTRIDVSPLAADFDEAFLAGDGLPELEAWLPGHLPRAARISPDVRLGPPIARPGKIVCIGLNYRDHAAERGMALPSEPVIFFKAIALGMKPEPRYLVPGDTVELGIDGLGTQRQQVRASLDG